jgi:hypothetical protein
MVSKPVREKFWTPRLIFQVTTKRNTPIVQETGDRVKMLLKNYSKKDFQKKLKRNKSQIFI